MNQLHRHQLEYCSWGGSSRACRTDRSLRTSDYVNRIEDDVHHLHWRKDGILIKLSVLVKMRLSQNLIVAVNVCLLYVIFCCEWQSIRRRFTRKIERGKVIVKCATINWQNVFWKCSEWYNNYKDYYTQVKITMESLKNCRRKQKGTIFFIIIFK